MLVVFVSLRVFTLQLWGDQLQSSKKYLRYITKSSNQAPHLEFFAIHYYDDDHTVSDDNIFRCKRVNTNWVVCDETEYPVP